jgi:hypothetical protein
MINEPKKCLQAFERVSVCSAVRAGAFQWEQSAKCALRFGLLPSTWGRRSYFRARHLYKTSCFSATHHFLYSIFGVPINLRRTSLGVARAVGIISGCIAILGIPGSGPALTGFMS